MKNSPSSLQLEKSHTKQGRPSTAKIIIFLKKNEIMPFAATWMDLDLHTKRRKSGRERQLSYHITYMWNLKKKYTSELICKAEINSQT